MCIVDRVVSFFFAIPSYRIFASDNSLGLSAVFKMFVFDYTCERYFFLGIVDNSITLLVFGIKKLVFES